MANPFAGEVALTLDGTRYVLKLTLGALAELEAGDWSWQVCAGAAGPAVMMTY